MTVDPAVEAQQRDAVIAWRASRDEAAAEAALAELRRVAQTDENIMPATIAAAKAGVTTGEWSAALRETFGEFRAPTGVGEAAAGDRDESDLAALREEVERVTEAIGRRPKILVGKPGLDGHSNGAEQIAVRARDIGLGRRLRGHPPDARADRRVGRAGGRPHHRAVDPERLAPGADPERRAGAARARRRRAGRRRRDHPDRRRPAAEGRRRRGGLHAQGLRPRRDHARHRGARGGERPPRPAEA